MKDKKNPGSRECLSSLLALSETQSAKRDFSVCASVRHLSVCICHSTSVFTYGIENNLAQLSS